MQGAGERRLQAPMSTRYRDMLEGFLAGGWADQDLRGLRGWPLMRRGQRVVLEDHVSSPQERAASPLYTDLFRRHELDHLAALSFRSGGQQWCFNIARSQTMPEFDAALVAELNSLRPYFSRLVRFSEITTTAATSGAMAALEETAAGAILLDWTGRVAEINGPARRYLGAGLQVRSGRLCAERTEMQGELDGLVAATLSRDMSRAGSTARS